MFDNVRTGLPASMRITSDGMGAYTKSEITQDDATHLKTRLMLQSLEYFQISDEGSS